MLQPRLWLVLSTYVLLGHAALAQDWPQWRGPNGDNHADPSTDAPLRWDLTTSENVSWKTAIPGYGHSTPIVVGDSIFLTTADEDAGTQSVLKLDRQSGRLMDNWVLHRGTLPERIHSKNSYASPSPASDGERVFACFHTDDAIWLTALTFEGREVWKKKIGDFKPQRFQFGYGASPIVEDDLVIVASEYDGADSGLYALDVQSGQVVWNAKRPVNLNFASPIAATLAGKRQILLAGGELICSYDPPSGRELWRVETTTEAICGTVVWDDRRVLISGGNPDSGTWCVAGDGSRNLIWDNQIKCYEQSLLTISNYVFAVADNGVAFCWRTVDGKPMWQKRLFGGGVSASPTLVRDRIYIASERGTVYVLAATPDRFDLLAENQTGDSIFATPLAIDDRLLIRTTVIEGPKQQQYLVALGQQ
ncbi:outer membrane protein assembly factor BamB family protein [Novipirellula artificiosorum]|uniref:Outer membrane biogenesis protein BamB n=1 Tax=Novipirellula artificiosorum TaxID=2528016 RepID=A0A5C6E069_9BACT|nr:PQQ-binding-like beta-propeller repeat protein [Novipirellula artificiosorum]TWU41091.1 outer membrane biogenesis protein BamB [Novipirellula artificiosorum]